MAAGERDVRFQVTGGFTLDTSKIEEDVLDAAGEIVGFKLRDGRTVKLIVALEVEVAEGDDSTNEEFYDVTKETEMEQLGFHCLNYDRADFEEV